MLAGIFRVMENSLRSSRCAVVVLCPTFVASFNENWFHLLNLITDIDVIYVLYGGLDVTTVTQRSSLGRHAVPASIRNSRCVTWSWPIGDDARRGVGEKLNMALFWCHLKLAIPNRRRRIAPAASSGDRLLPVTA